MIDTEEFIDASIFCDKRSSSSNVPRSTPDMHARGIVRGWSCKVLLIQKVVLSTGYRGVDLEIVRSSYSQSMGISIVAFKSDVDIISCAWITYQQTGIFG
jgi:hypothetical protein